jgi:DNA-directed RNA polymerase sigma subunit (sigma70/sigma32)
MDAIDAKHVLSIDRPFNDGNNKTLSDIIPDNKTSIEDVLDSRYIREQIILAFKNLTKREELILRLRFGINETLENDENIHDIQ